MKRCNWAVGSDLEEKYHDEEWGIPEHKDQKLFEMLILEGMQAGLSWSTILKKRETMREAFDQFDYTKIANYDQYKVDSLLENSGIIRNKLKVNAAINNAKQFIKIQSDYGSFDQFIWKYVDDTPINNQWKTMDEIPASSELSDTISKDLKKMGFKFVGTTIIYAYMQAISMVNDHLTNCFRKKFV